MYNILKILILLLFNGLSMAADGLQVGLETSDWRLGHYLDSSGQVMTVLPDTTVTASFMGGKLSGIAGCNTFNASYEIKGDRITMGPAMTTRKHCAEPDGIMGQEQEYLQALSRVRVFELTDTGLKLRDEKGSLQLNFVVGGETQ